jgi:PhzF family phenazine biosynthesis protein
MKLKIFQIDAFTNKVFGGNPAAVIPLEKWLDDELMQAIARENNLSETAFFVPSSKEINQADSFELRWFTPGFEINLCGHATLAAAYVIFNFLGYDKNEISFQTKSGELKVYKDNEKIAMNFPSWNPERISDYNPELITALGNPEIVGVYKNRELIVELMDEEAVLKCNPDFTIIKKLPEMVIITAPGRNVDFVSRFFAPQAGINEDPVTGSAHSQLIPFWSDKLSKTVMTARQLSERGGYIWCEQLNAERVMMSGEAVFYMEGEITLKISNS